MDEREQLDIQIMRGAGLVHVEDPNALKAFNEGKLLFDVSEKGEKLSAFVDHNPGVRSTIRTGPTTGEYPSAIGFLPNNRKVYFGHKQ